jgi:hypothetical protein
MIEVWTPNSTVAACCNSTGGPHPAYYDSGGISGGLFNGMVQPFINMTIKGVLWYQGENNLGQCEAGKWFVISVFWGA